MEVWQYPIRDEFEILFELAAPGTIAAPVSFKITYTTKTSNAQRDRISILILYTSLSLKAFATASLFEFT
jgi:hypothetical protein